MMNMRLTNRHIGMPYEEFHWNDIQIPWVVNHHILMAETSPSIVRLPLSELKYSLKHYNPHSTRSIHRFLGALEESVESGRMRESLKMGVTGNLKVLLIEDDPGLAFDTLTTVVKCVHEDPRGSFSEEFIEGDGLEILLGLVELEEEKVTDNDSMRRNHYIRMIRGNSIYVLGNLIHNHGRDLMFPHVQDILFSKLKEEDWTERCNALFCFRMAIESGSKEVRFDELGRQVLEMKGDPVEAVRDEASELLSVLVREDLIDRCDCL